MELSCPRSQLVFERQTSAGRIPGSYLRRSPTERSSPFVRSSPRRSGSPPCIPQLLNAGGGAVLRSFQQMGIETLRGRNVGVTQNELHLDVTGPGRPQQRGRRMAQMMWCQSLQLLGCRHCVDRRFRTAQTLRHQSLALPHCPAHGGGADQGPKVTRQITIPAETSAVHARQERGVGCRLSPPMQMFAQELSQLRTNDHGAVPSALWRGVANQAPFHLDNRLADPDPLGQRSTSPTTVPATSDRRPPVPSKSSKRGGPDRYPACRTAFR